MEHQVRAAEAEAGDAKARHVLVSSRLHQALKAASLQRRRDGWWPGTLREIVDVALANWLVYENYGDLLDDPSQGFWANTKTKKSFGCDE